MKLLADKDERFKGLFVKVLILILIAVIGLMLNLVISVIKKGYFTPKTEINFTAESGQDIKVGMPVKLSGFKIGAVSKIDLDDQAHALVELLIENRYMHLLNEDAVLSIKKEGIIGDSILEVKRGKEGLPPLQKDANIKFERGGGLEQVANDLRDKLYPTLDEINKLLKDINNPQGDIHRTLANVRQLTDELHGTHARINQLIASVQKSAESAEGVVGKLNQALPGMLQKTDDGLENLRRSTESVKSAIETSSSNLSGVMGETRGLISDTRNIMDSASGTWPLKNMLPPPEQGLIKMDSHD